MQIELIHSDANGAGLRVGIVQARFNEAIGEAIKVACVKELRRLGVAAENIVCATVPGALEIPFALQQMAQHETFDALVAVGAVIQGETYHFEVVSNQSAAGVAQVSLEYDIPVANAILTTRDTLQAEQRAQVKGTEAACVAVEMANLALALLEREADDSFEEDV